MAAQPIIWGVWWYSLVAVGVFWHTNTNNRYTNTLTAHVGGPKVPKPAKVCQQPNQHDKPTAFGAPNFAKSVSPLLAALPSAGAAEGMLLRWQSIIHAPMHCNVGCPQELGRSCNDSTLATHSRPLCPAAANRSCWRYLLFPSVLQIVLSACRSLEPVR